MCPSRMREWWDIDALTALYARVLRRVAAGRPARSAPAPAEAFATYVPMLTSWRRLPYLDPGLPLEHLPPDWPGIEAGDLFARLDGQLRDDAHKHAHGIVHG